MATGRRKARRRGRVSTEGTAQPAAPSICNRVNGVLDEAGFDLEMELLHQRVSKQVTLNLRATRMQTVLIDQTAEVLGRCRLDFGLYTLRRESEYVLLDQRYFALSTEALRQFALMLGRPPKDNPRLRWLLETRAAWER